MTEGRLHELSVADALAGLRDRSFSAREYCEALIARCEANRHLNAFVSHDWDALRKAASASDGGGGRLAGIPFVLKDNIDTAGLPTTGATGALRGFRPRKDAAVAAAVFAEGALLAAKGNMHELAFGITGNNAVTGAARNPYDPSMIPGGSSSGVAVAVAARMLPAGIGTDTGASVRLPAALCGVVGFRPTVGRYASAGMMLLSGTRDTAGPITRTVADAALIDAILAGEAAGLPPLDAKGLRIGIPRAYFYDGLDPEVARVSAGVLDLLAGEGVVLVEADIPDIGPLDQAVSFPVVLYECVRELSAYLRERELDLTLADLVAGVGSPDVRAIIAAASGEGAIPEQAYRQALGVDRARLRDAYARYFAARGVEAVLFPTAPLPARPIGEDETVELNGERVPTFATYIRNTDPASNAGVPGISIPAGLTAGGLPVGIELDAPAGADRRLLRIARLLEEIIGFKAAPQDA